MMSSQMRYFTLIRVAEHLVVVINPNCPKRIAMARMPNLNLFDKFLRSLFPKEGLFQMKTIIVAGPNPMRFMHDTMTHR